MSETGWTSRVATAAGAAAGTGAAQLGLGYGLGVVVWPVAATQDDSAWLGSLGWATWITASATVFGAVIASRLGGGLPTRFRGPWRLTLAASAAIGALAAVALIALPARSAVRVDTYSPQVIAGGYALLGLVLGLVIAYWAVACRPVAANLIGTAAWLWALAIAAIVVELTLHRSSATYLTSWQFAETVDGVRYGTIYWPSGLLTLVAAFLVGIVTAAPAARRGDLGVGAATSGAVGPLLVAVAFLALAPRLTGSVGPLESAYLLAPYAVLAGLAGSVLAVSVGRAAADRRAARTATRPDPDDRKTGHRSELTDPNGGHQADRIDRDGGYRADRTDRDSGHRADRTDRDSGHRAESTDPGTDHRTGPSQPSTDTDAVPAAEPPVEPVKTAPKTKAPIPAGRAKPPTTDPAAGAARRTTPGTPPARTAGTPAAPRPTDATAAPRPTGTTAAPRAAGDTAPPPAAGAARSGRSTESAASRGAATGQDEREQKGKSGGSAPSADPEIAAAAGPPRPRPRKAAPTPDNKPPKSTVTPPPADPTIAQINPSPPKNG